MLAPIPLEAPVTTATLFFRSAILRLLTSRLRHSVSFRYLSKCLSDQMCWVAGGFVKIYAGWTKSWPGVPGTHLIRRVSESCERTCPGEQFRSIPPSPALSCDGTEWPGLCDALS